MSNIPNKNLGLRWHIKFSNKIVNRKGNMRLRSNKTSHKRFDGKKARRFQKLKYIISQMSSQSIHYLGKKVYIPRPFCFVYLFLNGAHGSAIVRFRGNNFNRLMLYFILIIINSCCSYYCDCNNMLLLIYKYDGLSFFFFFFCSVMYSFLCLVHKLLYWIAKSFWLPLLLLSKPCLLLAGTDLE